MTLRNRVGAVTIGQSPRDDVVPHLRAALGHGSEIVEVGALDGLSKEEIDAQMTRATGALLVTRLRGGGPIRVREGLVTPRIRACVSSLQGRVELIVFLCTGDFPDLESSVPILLPGPMLRYTVQGLGLDRVGIITPDREQIASQRERWTGVSRQVMVEEASPYGSAEELERAAEHLRRAAVDAVAMDCIGYTYEMKCRVRAVVRRPVLTATTLLARVAAELMD